MINEIFNNDPEKSAGEFIKGSKSLKTSSPEGLIKKGLVSSQKDYTKWLNSFAREYCRLKLKQVDSSDKVLMQASEALSEIDQGLNIHYERLSEMYGFYWPESVKESGSLKALIKNIEQPGQRPAKSLGYNITEKDLSVIRLFAEKINNLIKLRQDVEDYINKRVKELAPRTSEVATPLIAAKLITLAGGLKRLAGMPSSTIQVLGAEKALFRHLRKGARPPKHGVIIQHPSISGAKAKERGKAARKLANKIAIAARSDYYEKR